MRKELRRIHASERSLKPRLFGVASVGLLGLAGTWWGLQSPQAAPELQQATPEEFGAAKPRGDTTRAPARAESTRPQPASRAVANGSVGALRQAVLHQVRTAASQAASEPQNVVTPEHAFDPNEKDLNAAFAELAQARKQRAQEPDLELAEGLLTALKDEAVPMERFALINAYLDSVAGIEDPLQAKAAIARLAEAGAAPDAVYN